MIRNLKKKSNKKKLYDYYDIGLINGAFQLEISAVEKSVLVIISSESRFRKYVYSPELSYKVGCALCTTKKAITSLINAGHLLRIQKGEYATIVKASEKSFLNIKQFSIGLKLPLRHTDKIVLLSTIRYVSLDRDVCYPKISTISQDCSLTPKTVSSVYTRLKKMGLIERFKQKNRWYVRSHLEGIEHPEKFVSAVFEKGNRSISKGICKKNLVRKKTNVNENELGQAQQDHPAFLSEKQKESKNDRKRKRAYHKGLTPNISDFIFLWLQSIAKIKNIKVSKLNKKEKLELVYIYTTLQDNNHDPFKFINFVLSNWDLCYNYMISKFGDYKVTQIPNTEYISENLTWLFSFQLTSCGP